MPSWRVPRTHSTRTRVAARLHASSSSACLGAGLPIGRAGAMHGIEFLLHIPFGCVQPFVARHSLQSHHSYMRVLEYVYVMRVHVPVD